MLTLTLWDTKTEKGRAGLPEYAVICDRREKQGHKHKDWDPVEMLDAWNARCQELGKRKLNDKIFTITRDDYNQRLKLALRAIGIRSERYGTHSGRIGGATMLWEGGASDAEIMELGRWKSDSWKIYCRQVRTKCLRLSKLLNNSKLTQGSLVGSDIDLSIEIDMRENEYLGSEDNELVGRERWSASKSREVIIGRGRGDNTGYSEAIIDYESRR